MFPKTVDWDSFTFRCSQLGDLMSGPRAKEGELQKTTKKELDKIWRREVWGIEEEINSKYFDKGIIQQEAAIALLCQTIYPNQYLRENKERFQNEFLNGRPDLIIDGKVHDTKCSWSMETFMNAQPIGGDTPNRTIHKYEWQLRGYMFLLKIDKAELNPCLVDTPEGLVYDEVKRHTFYRGIDEMDPRYSEIEAQIEHNHTPSRYVPVDLRVKRFPIVREEVYEDMIRAQVPIWREYLKNKTL